MKNNKQRKKLIDQLKYDVLKDFMTDCDHMQGHNAADNVASDFYDFAYSLAFESDDTKIKDLKDNAEVIDRAERAREEGIFQEDPEISFMENYETFLRTGYHVLLFEQFHEEHELITKIIASEETD